MVGSPDLRGRSKGWEIRGSKSHLQQHSGSSCSAVKCADFRAAHREIRDPRTRQVAISISGKLQDASSSLWEAGKSLLIDFAGRARGSQLHRPARGR